jgi:hypothetical protein
MPNLGGIHDRGAFYPPCRRLSAARQGSACSFGETREAGFQLEVKLTSMPSSRFAAHPGRSTKWLEARIAFGFHGHHIGGDRENSDDDNLVLVEGEDQMRSGGM